MRDMQVESLIRTYGSYTRECEVFSKYHTRHATAMEGCTEEERNKTQFEFQSCSHPISLSAVSPLAQIYYQAPIFRNLCKALQQIQHQCGGIINTCFNTKDSEVMLSAHLKEIREYFQHQIHQIIPEAELNCEKITGEEVEVIKDSDSDALPYTQSVQPTQPTNPTQSMNPSLYLPTFQPIFLNQPTHEVSSTYPTLYINSHQSKYYTQTKYSVQSIIPIQTPRPTQYKESTRFVYQNQPGDPTRTYQFPHTTQPTYLTQSAAITHSNVLSQPTDSTQSTDTNQPNVYTQPANTPQSVDTNLPNVFTQPPNTPQSVDTNQPNVFTQPPNTPQSVDTSQPNVFTQPANTPQSSDTNQPNVFTQPTNSPQSSDTNQPNVFSLFTQMTEGLYQLILQPELVQSTQATEPNQISEQSQQPDSTQPNPPTPEHKLPQSEWSESKVLEAELLHINWWPQSGVSQASGNENKGKQFGWAEWEDDKQKEHYHIIKVDDKEKKENDKIKEFLKKEKNKNNEDRTNIFYVPTGSSSIIHTDFILSAVTIFCMCLSCHLLY